MKQNLSDIFHITDKGRGYTLQYLNIMTINHLGIWHFIVFSGILCLYFIITKYATRKPKFCLKIRLYIFFKKNFFLLFCKLKLIKVFTFSFAKEPKLFKLCTPFNISFNPFSFYLVFHFRLNQKFEVIYSLTKKV